MPQAALRPCATCHQVGCTAHVRPAWGSARPVQRIRGRKLQRLRMDLWAKEPQCRVCKRVLLPKQMIRDHVINLADGGADDTTNEQPICQPCHDAKTQREAQRGARLKSCQ